MESGALTDMRGQRVSKSNLARGTPVSKKDVRRIIKLSKSQRKSLLETVAVAKKSQAPFCKEIGKLVRDYRSLRMQKQYAVPQVTKLLRAIERSAKEFRTQVLRLAEKSMNEPNVDLARTFLLGKLREDSGTWAPVSKLSSLRHICCLVDQVREAARESIELASQKKGRKPNEAGDLFVIQLEECYVRYTGKTACISRASDFGKFVKMCFSFANHEIADILPNLKILKPTRKN